MYVEDTAENGPNLGAEMEDEGHDDDDDHVDRNDDVDAVLNLNHHIQADLEDNVDFNADGGEQLGCGVDIDIALLDRTTIIIGFLEEGLQLQQEGEQDFDVDFFLVLDSEQQPDLEGSDLDLKIEENAGEGVALAAPRGAVAFLELRLGFAFHELRPDFDGGSRA